MQSKLEYPYDEPIVFFDGYCHLCNATVNLCMRMDGKRRLRYASIQSKTAERLIGAIESADMQSVLCYDKGTLHEHSDAILVIGAHLSWPWKAVKYLRVLPKSWRDRVYLWVARNRYRWFGKRTVCRVPSEADQGLLLE